MTLLRFVVIRHGVIAASRGGKAKTLLQAVAIGLYVLPLSRRRCTSWPRWSMAVAVVVTVVDRPGLRRPGGRAAAHQRAHRDPPGGRDRRRADRERSGA